MSAYKVGATDLRISMAERAKANRIHIKGDCPFCGDFLVICRANKRQLLDFVKERPLSFEMKQFLAEHEKLAIRPSGSSNNTPKENVALCQLLNATGKDTSRTKCKSWE